jgi:hypothetical protein
MEQDLGPASTLLAAREDSPRGASVRGSPVGVPRSRPSSRGCSQLAGAGYASSAINPDRWPVFGTGGNDQQRQAWAFVPRR